MSSIELTCAYSVMTEPQVPDNEEHTAKPPWTSLRGVPLAFAAGIGLLIGYFYGARHGEFYFEAFGIKLIGKPPSDVATLIDLANPLQQPRVIDAMVRKISEYDRASPLGKRIISMAKERSNPFLWPGQAASLEYKEGLPKSLYFQVCRGNRFSGMEATVDVEVKGQTRVFDQGVLSEMPPDSNCNAGLIYTGNKRLVEEAKKEGARVLFTEVVRLPYPKFP